MVIIIRNAYSPGNSAVPCIDRFAEPDRNRIFHHCQRNLSVHGPITNIPAGTNPAGINSIVIMRPSYNTAPEHSRARNTFLLYPPGGIRGSQTG